ncbi:MAG: hypothetical protein JNN15_13875 [Blastocatellia bacterium]|nr:hypothetical protein [Blastocatellia bacterium]
MIVLTGIHSKTCEAFIIKEFTSIFISSFYQEELEKSRFKNHILELFNQDVYRNYIQVV